MFNEPPDELRNVQRKIDRIVDAMIAFLPPEEQSKIIKKEADRRERNRIQTTILEAKRQALEKELEAIETEAEHQRKRRLRQWQQQTDELQQALGSVPETALLFRHMIEFMFEGCQKMATSQERVKLMKTINEKRHELSVRFDEELDQLAERMMIALTAPAEQVEIRNAMAKLRAAMRTTPPHIDFVTGVNNTRFFKE